MPKFSIAFVAPEGKTSLKHLVIDSPDQESALKKFFDENMTEFYSNDDQGYFYFKEDFFDANNPAGSIVDCH